MRRDVSYPQKNFCRPSNEYLGATNKRFSERNGHFSEHPPCIRENSRDTCTVRTLFQGWQVPLNTKRGSLVVPLVVVRTSVGTQFPRMVHQGIVGKSSLPLLNIFDATSLDDLAKHFKQHVQHTRIEVPNPPRSMMKEPQLTMSALIAAPRSIAKPYPYQT